MKENEIIIFTVAMAEHFPQASDGDVRLAMQDMERYPIECVKESIVRHRRELGSKIFRPSPERLLSICRSLAESKATASEPATAVVLAQWESRERAFAADDLFISQMPFAEFEAIVEEILNEVPSLRRIKKPYDNKPIRSIVCLRAKSKATAGA